jgi:hypothetical protein
LKNNSFITGQSTGMENPIKSHDITWLDVTEGRDAELTRSIRMSQQN